MTVSRNSILAVVALVAAVVFLFSSATVGATGEANVQFAQHISVPAAAESANAGDMARVVVTGRRMTAAEKAAFDRSQS